MLIVFVTLMAVLSLRFIAGGDEDNWICSNNRWVKHGNPRSPSPQTGCGKETLAKEPTVTLASERSANQAVAEEFSKKYKRPLDAFTIEVGVDTGSFARGSVRFKGEMDGGLWFAAKTVNGWTLVFDGQGAMSCESADKFNFPKDMVPACVDIQNGNMFVQR
jgi:hypothetical protein